MPQPHSKIEPLDHIQKLSPSTTSKWTTTQNNLGSSAPCLLTGMWHWLATATCKHQLKLNFCKHFKVVWAIDAKQNLSWATSQVIEQFSNFSHSEILKWQNHWQITLFWLCSNLFNSRKSFWMLKTIQFLWSNQKTTAIWCFTEVINLEMRTNCWYCTNVRILRFCQNVHTESRSHNTIWNVWLIFLDCMHVISINWTKLMSFDSKKVDFRTVSHKIPAAIPTGDATAERTSPWKTFLALSRFCFFCSVFLAGS